MDLQTRKLEAIGHLISIQDEELFAKVESVINESYKKDTNYLKQFTQEEIINRAEESNQDYLAGRYITQEDLEKESENW